MAERDGITEGLIAVFSVLEPRWSFAVVPNRHTHRLEVVRRRRKCLHFYFYLYDPEFGFMHVRLQSWFPFSATIALARCLGNPVSLLRLDLVWCPGARRLYCGHGHVVLPGTPGGAILERLLRVEPARVRRTALVTALEPRTRARPEALTRALREACGIVCPVGLTLKTTPAPTGDRIRLEHAGRA